MGHDLSENFLGGLEWIVEKGVENNESLAPIVDGYIQALNRANEGASRPSIDLNEAVYLQIISNAIMQSVVHAELRPLNWLLGHCESPIERIFISALWYHAMCITAFAEGRPAVLTNDGKHVGTPFIEESLTIEPQAKVGDYRVDFRLTYVEGIPDFDNRDERGIPGVKIFRKAILIECDGHDFHERTKEQAARDKARDRDLQAAGFHVFRFTGSEIWNQPAQCASQIFKVLTDWSDA